jgi:hypothetical protein
MYSEYAELLSFKDLDQAIAEFNGAYLDMNLLELRHSYADKDEYWKQVTPFRRNKLDPFTPQPGERQLTGSEFTEAGNQYQASLDYFVYQRGFVYWFDWRARFWADSDHASVQSLVKILVPPKSLQSLRTQAELLQKRIRQTQTLVSAPAQLSMIAQSAVAPAPEELLRMQSRISLLQQLLA